MWTGPVDNPRVDGRLTAGTDFPGSGALTWRSPRSLTAVLAVVAALAVAGAVALPGPLDRLVAATVGLVLAGAALTTGRRRLVGGPRGLLVVRLTGSRIVPWSMVDAIDCGRTKRMGSATVEIDLVDDELLLFGRTELGTDPAEVADRLRAWWRSRPPA
jgi:hypothetical protein